MAKEVDAVHISTKGFYCKACPKVVENAIGVVPGVVDVVSVHSLNLTSVLFDPDLVDVAELCQRIRSAGFGAEIFCAHDVENACPAGGQALSESQE